MVKVSVIIVTYNAQEFIAHCLESIMASSLDDETVEVIIVDNASIDLTTTIIKQLFKQARIICNPTNLGFAKACNIGAKQSQGDYLLFLNPDCILDSKALRALSMAGRLLGRDTVLGGLLYDGGLKLLPESARTLPTFKTSFGRITQLDKIFKSLSYYQDLSPKIMTQVEVLTGAFLWLPADIFEKVGGYDELYFLYGEDVDLCKRLFDEGVKSYVIPDAKAVHFKGESGRHSWKQIKAFYHSLYIYSRQHLNLSCFSTMVIRLMMSLLATVMYIWSNGRRFFKEIIEYVFVSIVTAGAWGYFFHGYIDHFNWTLVLMISILLSIIYVLVLYFSGYFISGKSKKSDLFSVPILATLIIMMGYAVLPESWRFSRFVVVFATLIFSFRKIYCLTKTNANLLTFSDAMHRDLRRAIQEIIPQAQFVEASQANAQIITLKNLVIEEHMNSKDQEYYYYSREGNSLFNSTRSYTAGTGFGTLYKFNLSHQTYRFKKQLVDRFCSFILLLVLPFTLYHRSSELYRQNVADLWLNKKTMIGDYMAMNSVTNRPFLGNGIITLEDPNSKSISEQSTYDYALHYSVIKDVYLCITKFGQIWKSMFLYEE